ncbi:MAG: hypothetical protein CMB29_06045 [Euryarchaeota archaeon]|nr:hypothetical protein [Euryarchaeota archaeon]
MANRAISIILLILLAGVIAASTVSAQDDSYKPGYIDWEVNPVEQLFVEGMTETSAVLQRERPDQTEGGISLDPLFNGEIFTIQSQPVQTGFSQTVKMTVFFSVYLDDNVGPETCFRQQTTSLQLSDATTTLTYTVSLGGEQIYQESVTEIVDEITSGQAMNFSGAENEINITANPGDVFTLSLSGVHNCLGSSVMVQWGGGPEPQNSGGIIMIGTLYQPEMRMILDEANIAHIEFEPLMPWGATDIRDIKWEIWGPLKDFEKISLSNDNKLEDSTGKTLTVRQLNDNDSIWTWSGKKVLTNGELNLQMCVRTVYGDLNSECHAFGILRFEVTADDSGFLSAKIFLTLSALIALLAFVGNAFNQGLLIPIPILSALAVMMLLFVPTAFSQNNLGADAAIYDNTRVPNAELFDENGESVTITDLFDGRDAMIIGVGLPASENLIEQSNQFNETIDRYGDDIAVIHVLSGMEPMSSDIVQMRQQLNTSWPILIDKNEQFASTLPDGVSDSVVIIDKAMHVTYSKTPVAYADDISEAIDEIPAGGPQNLGAYFALLVGPGLFLFFIALPREGWTPPDEPLPPGSLWASIIGAGAAGILLVNIPVLIATILPLGTGLLFYLDIVMMLWFVEMAFFTAKNGKPFEAALLGKVIHGLYPKYFQDWRPLEDMERDLLIGIWFGWFGMLAFPALFPQAIGAAVLSGIGGILRSVLSLVLILALGGLAVLSLRIIAAGGGPISRLFGRFGAESFTQFVGWLTLPLAIWVTINAILTSMNVGLL